MFVNVIVAGRERIAESKSVLTIAETHPGGDFVEKAKAAIVSLVSEASIAVWMKTTL